MTAVRYIVIALLAGTVAVALAPGAARAQQVAPVSHRVWSGDSVDLSGSPSPNDRFFSYVDWTTGDLAIRDLQTGQSRHLTSKGTWDQSIDHAAGSVFSPDTRRIAYAWGTAEDTLAQIRVMALDSLLPRVLYQVPVRQGRPDPVDWTPDGRFVIVTSRALDGNAEIILIPVAGGAPRIVKHFSDRRSLGAVRISPDGKQLAYDYSPRSSNGSREFGFLSIDGRRESAAVKSTNGNHLIGWAPDGSRLIFGHEGDATPSVWSISVDGGQAKGSLTLLRSDMWGSNGLRLTARGTLFYAVTSGARDVLIASYDPVSGRLLSEQGHLLLHQGGDSYHPAWSPDGNFISYVEVGANPEVIGSGTITIRPANGGQDVVVLQPTVANLDRSVWTPDGKALVLQARDPAGRNGLFRLDLQTRLVTRLARPTQTPPAFSRDSQWMYFVPSSPADQRRPMLVAHNLLTGAERTVYAAPEGTNIPPGKSIVTSPDGKQILFETSVCCPFTTQLQLISVTGGQPNPVRLVDPGHRVVLNQNPIGFSPDGRYVLFFARRSDDLDGPAAIWRVPVEGGNPEEILGSIRRADAAKGFPAISGPPKLSPDGRRLLYFAGDNSPELWTMEIPAIRSPATPNRR